MIAPLSTGILFTDAAYFVLLVPPIVLLKGLLDRWVWRIA
jgi:hypothetical protein